MTSPGFRLADRVDQHPQEMQPEHLVVAIGTRLRQRQREQAARFQVAQDGDAVGPIQDAVTQGTSQAPQDAGADKELAELVRQIRDDVARQIFAGQTGCRTCEPVQQTSALHRRLALGRKVEQLQASRPALRATSERRELLWRQRLAVDISIQLLHLP